MTAETLKPFISLPGSTTYKSSQSSSKRNAYVIWICTVLILVIVFSSLLGFSIWNSVQISELEKETNSLKNLLATMQKRLGLDYLDDLDKFEEAYSKNILDDPNSSEGVLLDSYEDDDDDDLDNLNENDDNDSFADEIDGSGEYDYDEDEYDESNLYDDFEKFKKNKEIKEDEDNKDRKTRSTTYKETAYGIPIYRESYAKTRNRTGGPEDDEIEELLLKKKKIQKLLFHHDWNKESPRTELDKSENSKYLEFRKPSEKIHRMSVDEFRRNFGYKNEGSQMDQQSNDQGHRHYHTHHHKPIKNIVEQGRQGVSRSRTVAIQLTLNQIQPYLENENFLKGKSDGDLYLGEIQNETFIQTSYPDKIFIIENGIIRIKLEGFYYVYAQVYYNNQFNSNGFNIFHNNEPLSQCVHSTSTTKSLLNMNNDLKEDTCFTSGIVYLKHNDIIYIRDLYKNHSSSDSLNNTKSFFGLIRLR